jgi:phospholipid/cholesterol/gamma-HCH transport system permease protein
MSIAIRVDREADHASLVPMGPFELDHATEVAQEVSRTESSLSGCRSVDINLARLEGIDGTGAVLLARLLDRLARDGCRVGMVENFNPEAARLISLYRERRVELPVPNPPAMGFLSRIGALAAELPGKANDALDFIGRCAVALPKAVTIPSSVDWHSLPRLIQSIGADALPVASAANLLIGGIIGFLGVSQLGRFGGIAYVPELVVVAQFRELGPLVTAIIVAGRSGAGLASEIATMKVSEEIDALQSMGFDPIRWLIVPRCLALALTVPLLTWIGDLLALFGGFLATIVMTDMTPRAYVRGTVAAITAGHLLTGLLKSPVLAVAIGVIACGQGLATRGGAAAVGARTTTAVVMAIFSVIVISAIFTFFYALMGI